MLKKHDIKRDTCQLYGSQGKCGYDWWWHSFTGINEKTGQERQFFIEYFLCNKKLGKDVPVLGQTEENQRNGIRPSYFMVKAGAWGEDARQLHRFFAWNETKVNFTAPYKLMAQDCKATETAICGNISITEDDAEAHPEWMCDSGSMSWNLKIRKAVPFNVGFGADSFFRSIQLFEMFWHAEGMKTYYKGEVIFNGEKYIISPKTCYGYADKNWGRNFTTPWLWLSSNDLYSRKYARKLEHSVFDIGGGRPTIGHVVHLRLTGKLLSAFYYEGRFYEFNFSKFWTFTRTKYVCHETDTEVIWHVEQKNLTGRMVTDVRCFKKDMILVNYESPDGKRRHTRLWNGGNGTGVISLYHFGRLIDTVEAKHIGCEYGEYDADKPY